MLHGPKRVMSGGPHVIIKLHKAQPYIARLDTIYIYLLRIITFQIKTETLMMVKLILDVLGQKVAD